MKHSRVGFSLGLILALGFLGGREPEDTLAQSTPDVYSREVQPLVAKYCQNCHGSRKQEAKVDLERFRSEADVLADRKTWKKVLDMLHNREMPPLDKTQPTPEERDKLTDWIEDILKRVPAGTVRDPGPVVVRRLNRREYNNTVMELLGIPRPSFWWDPSKGMPDRIRVLLFRAHYRYDVAELPPDEVAYGFENIGEVLSLPPFLMEKYLHASSQVVEKVRKESWNVLVKAKGTPTRETARAALQAFLLKAFRRPVADKELEDHLKLYDLAIGKGESHERAMKVPVMAALASPDFLFRIEADRPGDDPKGARALDDYELASRLSYFLWSSMPDATLFTLAAQGKLKDPAVLEEQARRMLKTAKMRELSENFGLQWLQLGSILSVMPDPKLFPKFYSGHYIPNGMRLEALLLFETIVSEDRSVLEFIQPSFIYLSGGMATFYGFTMPESKEKQRPQDAAAYWQRVPATDPKRGGILTLGAVMAATSGATETNPVKRGKWILETVFNTPPPPPLDNVPSLEQSAPPKAGMTLRDRLEQHRANPNCAGCHRKLDPPGFVLENYDPVGVWRSKDGKAPVDSSVTLPDGTSLKDIVEFKQFILTKKKDDFVRSLAEHLMTYALGRKVEWYDQPVIAEIVNNVRQDGYKFSRLIAEIVKSYPFRHRRNRGNDR